MSYLESKKTVENTEFWEHIEYMRKVTTANKQTDLDVYTKEINSYLKLEQFSINKIEYKIEELGEKFSKNSLNCISWNGKCLDFCDKKNVKER